MDAENIRTQVLFPSNALSIGFIRELDWAPVLASAYNDWLRDFCQHAPNGLKGVAVIAPQNAPAAVAEMERAVRAGHGRRDDADLHLPRPGHRPRAGLADLRPGRAVGRAAGLHATANAAVGNTRFIATSAST